MKCHRDGKRESTTCRAANHGNLLQNLVHAVKRNDTVTKLMQQARRQASRYFAIDVTHPVPLVVTAVEPDRDLSAWFQEAGKRLKSTLAIRCVVQHTDAIDHIEALGGKRKLKHISLQKGCISIGKVPCGHLACKAEVDADHSRPPSGGNISETAHTTAHVEHEFAGEVLRSKSGTLAEVLI